jgi:hypothetical protein
VTIWRFVAGANSWGFSYYSVTNLASFPVNPLEKLVGAGRFELPTPGPPDRCANRAALRSDVEIKP